MDTTRDREDVVIRLRYAEAVVLDALLSRWEEQGVTESLPFEDQAEQRVLWDLTASLEPVIDDVFSGATYNEVLSASRAEVRDPDQHDK